jgi:RHS repeat-associated protein
MDTKLEVTQLGAAMRDAQGIRQCFENVPLARKAKDLVPVRSRMHSGILRGLGVGLLLCGQIHSASAATTVTTTIGYDYDSAGLLKKVIVEPSDPSLCLVTEYDLDNFGRQRTITTRPCNGSTAGTPGSPNEAASPGLGSLAYLAPRATANTFSSDQRFVETTTNAAGEVETKKYDGRFGTLAKLIDPNALETTWTYDSLGRKTLERRADGTATKWNYVFCTGVFSGGGATPLVVPAGEASASCNSVPADSSVTNGSGGDSISPVYYIESIPLRVDLVTANGPYSRTYFDTLGREVRSETIGFDGAGAGRTIYQDTKYDRLGNIKAKSSPYFSGDAPNWTTFDHDVLGRTILKNEPSAAGTATTVTMYSGLTTTVTDPLQHVTAYVKNLAGQLAVTKDALQGTITRAYDPLGNVVRTTDVYGNTVSAVYDRRSRKTALYDPDIGIWAYDYNVANELKQQTDSKSQLTKLDYDSLGRLVNRVENDLVSTWYYCKAGDLSVYGKGIGQLCLASTDNGYSRKNFYDVAGRPTSTVTNINGVLYSASVGFDVNTGRVNSRTYPTGLVVNFIHSTLGYPWKVTDARTGLNLWQINSMDARGNLLQATYGNNVVTTNQYYPDNRLNTRAAGAGNSVQNLSYVYDLARNVKTRFDVLTGVNSTYEYDELNRLRQEGRSIIGVSGAQAIIWSYDAIGNIRTRTEDGVVNTYNYNTSGQGSKRPHAVANVGGYVNGKALPLYDYDANGNIATSAGRTACWTSFNMVRRLDAGGVRLEYLYQDEHERVQEKYFLNGSLQRTTLYLNPAAGNELFYEAESGVAGSKQKHYVSAGGATVAIITCTAAPCTNVANTSTQYLHEDHLGSVSVVTNSVGTVIERMAYEPFGKRRNVNGATDVYGTLTPATTDRGFTEHEGMDEVGLINMNGRVYDPALGRFMSADPNVPYPNLSQSYNRYSYVQNNPLGGIDPSGFVDYTEAPPYYTYPSPSFSQNSGQGGYSLYSGDLSSTGSGSFFDPYSFSRYSSGSGTTGFGTSGSNWGGSSSNLFGSNYYGSSSLLGWTSTSSNAALGGNPYQGFGAATLGYQNAFDQLNKLTPSSAEEWQSRLAGLNGLAAGYRATADQLGMSVAGDPFMSSLSLQTAIAKGQLGDRSGLTQMAATAVIIGIENGGNGGGARIGPRWQARNISSATCESGCEAVARQIQGHVGGEVVRIIPADAPMLGGFRGKNWGWSHHEVVVKDGRVYDLTTGHRGLPTEEYKNLWQYRGSINFGF